jgi:ATP-dependent RNA helicase SUPV3L1/SUV3
MTGSPDCIPLVQALAEYLGEPLRIEHLERHTPIEAERGRCRSRDIEPGTAVIAFSRRDVLAIKAELEQRFPVAVIYGNLTPEVRREEARRFRSGRGAGGGEHGRHRHGAEPAHRTVCFSTLEKWNGRDVVQLEPWEILQIGGRAGRFGKFERGHVGALDRRDAQRVAEVFAPGLRAAAPAVATTCGRARTTSRSSPTGLHTDRLAKALRAFQRGMTFDSPLLSPGVHDDMIALAEIVDRHRVHPAGRAADAGERAHRLAAGLADVEYGTWVRRGHGAGRSRWRRCGGLHEGAAATTRS